MPASPEKQRAWRACVKHVLGLLPRGLRTASRTHMEPLAKVLVQRGWTPEAPWCSDAVLMEARTLIDTTAKYHGQPIEKVIKMLGCRHWTKLTEEEKGVFFMERSSAWCKSRLLQGGSDSNTCLTHYCMRTSIICLSLHCCLVQMRQRS